jgi:hypothetical protein
MALKVVDRWTTQHGSWDVNPSKPYGIDQAHRDKYLAGRDIPGAGGDHHIFVNAKWGDFVEFDTEDQKNYIFFYVPESGWLNFPIYGGKWNVKVEGEMVAEVEGLPGGEHVSTFLVIGNVEEGSQTPPPVGDQWVEIVARTMVGGIQTKEEILWRSK